jgi:ATP-dependent DNA ligase
MKSCPTWWAGSPNCPRHPATAQVRSITQAVIKARRALRYDLDAVLAQRASAGARLLSWGRHLGRLNESSRSSRGGWVHEIKYDGYRTHACIDCGTSSY